MVLHLMNMRISVSILVIAMTKALMWASADTPLCAGVAMDAYLPNEIHNLQNFLPTTGESAVQHCHVPHAELAFVPEASAVSLRAQDAATTKRLLPMRPKYHAMRQMLVFASEQHDDDPDGHQADNLFNPTTPLMAVFALGCLFACKPAASGASSRSNGTPFVVACLALALALPTAHAAQPQAPVQGLRGVGSWHWDWLNKLLENVTIPIPNFNTTVSGVELAVTNAVCSHVEIQSLDVNLVPGNSSATARAPKKSASAFTPFLSLNTTAGIQRIECDMSYRVKVPLLPALHGNLVADVGDSLVLALVGLQYTHGNMLPCASDLSQCSASLKVTKLKFSGSISADIIELFTPVIKALVSSELSSQLCSLATPLVNTNLTNALATLDRTLQPFITTPTPSPTPAPPADAINWRNTFLASLSPLISNMAPSALNSLVDGATGGTGGKSLPVGVDLNFSGVLANYTVTLNTVAVKGLDTFDHAQLLVPSGDTSLTSSVRLGDVTLAVNVALVLHSNVAKQTLTFPNVTVSVSVREAMLLLRDDLAVSGSGLGGLVLAQLSSLPCAVSPLYSADLSRLDVAYEGAPVVRVTGFDPDFDAIVNDAVAMGYTMFANAAPVVLANVANGAVRTGFNSMLDDFMATGEIPMAVQMAAMMLGIPPQVMDALAAVGKAFNETCEMPPPPPHGTTVDFTSPVFQKFQELVDATLGNSSSPYSASNLVKSLTHGTGRLIMLGDVFSVDLTDARVGDLHLEVDNLVVANLDKLFGLSLMRPLGPSKLLLELGLGGTGTGTASPSPSPSPSPSSASSAVATGDKALLEAAQQQHPLRDDGKADALSVRATVVLRYKGEGDDISGAATFELDVSDLFFSTALQLDFEESVFWEVTVDHVIGDVSCFVGAMESLAMDKLDLTFGHLWGNLSLDVNSTLQGSVRTSVSMGGGDGDDNVNENVSYDPSFYFDDDEEEEKQRFGAGATDTRSKVEQLVRDAIAAFLPLAKSTGNSALTSLVKAEQEKCDGSSGSGKSYTVVYGVVGGVAGVTFIAAAFVFGKRLNERRSPRKSEMRLGEAHLGSRLMADEERAAASAANPDDLSWADLWESTLHKHEEVPVWARVVIPLALLGTMGLFLSGHLSLGAGVDIFVTYGDNTVLRYNLFSFTLANSVRDMWHAKVYALSLLIAVCSGGWPYLKSLLLGVCWFFPHKWLSKRGRERLLLALDALGKWSLVDAYVLVLFIVAFHFHLPNPNLILPGDIVSADVIVSPGWGIYGFLLAVVIQLIATHVIIHFHREAEGKHKSMRGMTGGESEAVRSHMFAMKLGAFSFRFTWFGQLLVTLVVLASVFMVVVGSNLVSFTFNFEGAAGVVLDLLGEERSSSYSVLSLGKEVPSQSRDPNDPGIRILQAVYILFVFIMPILHLFSLALLWATPLHVATQRVMFITVEIFNAWASLEVFVISIIAAILEISQFAQFIVGDRCDQINVLLKDMSHLFPNIYPPTEEDKCFDVVTTLDSGCWTLFGASFGALVIGQLVSRSCHRALEDRIVGYRVAAGGASSSTGSDSDSDNRCGCSWVRFAVGCAKALTFVGITKKVDEEESSTVILRNNNTIRSRSNLGE